MKASISVFTLVSVSALSLLGCDSSSVPTNSYEIGYHLKSGQCTLMNGASIPYSEVTYNNITFWARVQNQDGSPMANKNLIYAFNSTGQLLPQYQASLGGGIPGGIGTMQSALNVPATLFQTPLTTDANGMLTTSTTAQQVTVTQGSSSGQSSSSSSSSSSGFGGGFSLGIIGIGGGSSNQSSTSNSTYSSGFQIFSYQSTIPFWLPPQQFSGTVTIAASSGFTNLLPTTSQFSIGQADQYVRPITFKGDNPSLYEKTEKAKTSSVPNGIQVTGAILQGADAFCLAIESGGVQDYDPNCTEVDNAGSTDESTGPCSGTVAFFDENEQRVSCVQFLKRVNDLTNCISNYSASVTETYTTQ